MEIGKIVGIMSHRFLSMSNVFERFGRLCPIFAGNKKTAIWSKIFDKILNGGLLFHSGRNMGTRKQCGSSLTIALYYH